LTFDKKIAEIKELNAVIILGMCVKGMSRIVDYVVRGLLKGYRTHLCIDIPFHFRAINNDTMEQSEDRAGGKHGNN
jgi:6,7-dimethyl-8-ribityllumazine synthase